MFGSIGLPELILIFVVALLLFGPRKLPEIGRNIGRALGEFRRASNDLKRTIEEEVATEDLRQVGREVRQATTLPDAAAAPPPAPDIAPQAPGGETHLRGAGAEQGGEGVEGGEAGARLPRGES